MTARAGCIIPSSNRMVEEEMIAAFGADSEEIRNTVAIANQVDFEFEFGKFHFPNFRPDDTAAELPDSKLEELLDRNVRDGLAVRGSR